jgi:GNAT superfamily N-acetyltransferase
MTIQPIELPVSGIERLREEALEEGFRFVERLCEEWRNGENRFAAPGEALYGCVGAAGVVAVGGLNRDPFEGRAEVGRLRRVYVRPAWRKQGIGEALVRALIEQAWPRFGSLHLRTDQAAAARLYERLGFVRSSIPDATHVLRLDRTG